VTTVEQLAVMGRAVGFPILDRHTAVSTLWLITRGISEELEASLAADVVLVDRPVPDALGYYLAALHHRGEPPLPAWLDYLVAVTRHHAATYNLLLATRLDPTVPIGGGKPRDPDERFRMLADVHVNDVLAFSASRTSRCSGTARMPRWPGPSRFVVSQVPPMPTRRRPGRRSDRHVAVAHGPSSDAPNCRGSTYTPE
jgi:hypothetical protein